METRRQNVDPLAITQRNTRSNGGGESSEPIPTDLIIEILSRLPAKSIGRCRCVSKLWSSILGRPDFTELFLTRSSARPQLLFACQKYSELFFFSTPQPQNPDENSSPLAASYLMKIPFDSFFERFSPTNGLVYLRDELSLKGKINPELVSVIYNPSTGQSLPLPKMITKRRVGLKSYLGYDPIGKQFKVLSMTSSSFGSYYGVCEEHQVLTLGAKSPSWRMIECCIPHCPMYSEICIDGVLYYRASVNGSTEVTMLVCFDFRSEEFRFMEVMENFSRAVDVSATLVNYNGKLGSLMLEEASLVEGSFADSGSSKSLELWVLEDLEKHEWSKHIHVLPPLWRNVVGKTKLYFVGVIGTYEIVLSPHYPYDHFSIFYYNIKRNTIVRVEIQGMEAFKERSRFHTFINHVENLKLMAF